LPPLAFLDYSRRNWGSDYNESMQRLTARLLLLFALAGTFLPVALQATVAPAHACCWRKAVHHCHSSVETEPHEPVVSSAGCCNHDCCRALTTAQWAHSEPASDSIAERRIAGHEIEASPVPTRVGFSGSHFTRGPPAC